MVYSIRLPQLLFYYSLSKQVAHLNPGRPRNKAWVIVAQNNGNAVVKRYSYSSYLNAYSIHGEYYLDMGIC